MSSEYESLMRYVIESPDDDSPRLVLADWLEENSQPERAEFIRLQCELARLPPRYVISEEVAVNDGYGPDYFVVGVGALVDGCGMIVHRQLGERFDLLKPNYAYRKKQKPLYGLRLSKFTSDDSFADAVLVRDADSVPSQVPTLRRREMELLTNGGEWVKEICDFGEMPILWPNAVGNERIVSLPLGEQFEFRRGFVESIICSWQDWLAHHASIRAATPLRKMTGTHLPILIRGDSDADGLCKWHIHGGRELSVRMDPEARWEDAFEEICKTHWPGIAFHLPSE